MIKTRLLLPVLAALAAAAFFAGCGSSDDGGGSSDPAAFAPASSPLYIAGTVRPTGSLQANVDALASKLAGVDDLGGLIISQLEASASDSGEDFDYEKEVEPWLGEKAGLSFQKFDGEDFHGFAVAVETTDSGAAESFVDKQIGESDDEPVEESYEDNDYWLEDDTAVGVVGDSLIIAEGKASFEGAVDAEGGDSLADSEDFNSAMAGATEGSLADVFVDIGGLIEQSEGEIDEDTQQGLEAAGIDPRRSDRGRQPRARLQPGRDRHHDRRRRQRGLLDRAGGRASSPHCPRPRSPRLPCRKRASSWAASSTGSRRKEFRTRSSRMN